MSARTRSPLRRLAAEVLEADLGSPAALAAILARHAVTPARAFLGLPACTPSEDLNVPIGLSFGLDGRPLWPDKPRRLAIEPFLRGYVLLSSLVPGAVESRDDARAFLAAPGAALVKHALAVALLPWPHVELLARAILGERVAIPEPSPVISTYVPGSNRTGLAELASARELLAMALGEPGDPTELYARQSIGLTMLNRDTAFAIDEILRREVHWRLVWLGDVEVGFEAEAAPGPGGTAPLVPLVVDRGVIDVLVPETLAGLVVLDFVESLRERHGYAACAVCRRLVVLDPRRAGRHRRGEPVYHPDCHAEFRLRVVRDAQRRRRAGAAVNSRSAGDALTDGG